MTSTGIAKSYQTTEEMHQQHMDQTMMSHQQTPPSSEIASMGVYTPDSTTNSVHSMHYGQCDLDAQLDMESPASIASQNSVESIRPPSVLPQQMNQYNDCQMQQIQQQQQMNMSPQHQMQQNTTNCSRKMNQMNRANTPVVSNGSGRAPTPNISRNTATPGLQQHRSTPPMHVNQPMVSPVQHQQMNQQQMLHLQQMQGYHHQGMHQSNYLSPQMTNSGVNSNYAQAQSPNYHQSQSTGVIAQHRTMTNSHANMQTQNSLSSPQQRLGQSPSACPTPTNNSYYHAQQSHTPVPQASHTPVPILTPTPAATPTPQMDPQCQQQQQNHQGNMGNVSSLTKLQQLADTSSQQLCNTPPSVVLTPPPHLLNQNRSISTPPQPSMYAGYKWGVNMPPQNTGRNARTPAPPSVAQHMSTTSASRVSPSISSAMAVRYGYQMTGQQTSGYIGTPANFINNPSAMNMMQSQYQDPRTQQNSMYYNHPYLTGLPNSTPMRR